jgi:type IV pilus assembly protein PilO
MGGKYMLKDLSKREKYLLIVLGVTLVFYCYYRLLMLPIINGIVVSRANIDKYNDEINSQVLNSLVVQKDKKQLEELKANIDKSLAAFPKDERNPEIAYDIKAVSNNCNVLLGAINFGQAAEYSLQQGPKVSNKLMSVPVTLQVSGDYRNIINFILKIENDSRMAVVGSVALNETGGTLQSSISVNYLYMPSQNMIGAEYDFNNGTYGKDSLFK